MKMFKIATYSLVVMLSALIVLPSYTLAQTTTWNDGSGETRTERRNRIRNYRQQSSEMEQKITALGTVPVISIPVPVLFGVALNNISPNFGDPRSGGRFHEGEDIMAVSGTPIVSPTPAVVIRTGTGETEGLYVYTANPGGETFVYMHLDRIGENVVQGTVLPQGGLIGYVGNTGNASGGAAHLHFEMHDSSDNPMDPYPRISREFTLQEKISYLTTILSQTANSTLLAELLVTNFRSTFTTATAAGYMLPQAITNALATIPASTTGAPAQKVILPAGDLDIGSAGADVVSLQKYLIQAASGSAATRLSQAGATGNFGPLTQAALIEYQVKMNLTPANGYYGPITRAYITSHPLTTATPTIPTTPVSTIPPSAATLTRDLSKGMTGEDVRTLQKLLNMNGYVIAATGPGSIGLETTYFGAATQAAVIKLQIARSISPTAGYVGRLTRAVLATL